MSYNYLLIENGIQYFESSDIDSVLHEYLVVLKNHLLFCKNNNIRPSHSNNTNLYVVKTTKSVDAKFFNIYHEKYYFDLQNFNIVSYSKLQGSTKYFAQLILAELIEEIKELFPKSKQNQVPINIQPCEPVQPKQISLKSMIDATAKLVVEEPVINNVSETVMQIEKKPNVLDSNIIINNSDLSIDDISESELKAELDKLQKLRDDKLEKLFVLKDKHEEAVEGYTSLITDINSSKMSNRLQKDKLERKQREYDGAKSTYRKIKADLALPRNDSKIDENNIPVLFADKYPIFKFMDENNILDTDVEFDTYTEIYNKLTENQQTDDTVYVPHNFHYLDEDKKKHFEEFINTTKTNYPSVDDLLMQLEEKDRIDVMSDMTKSSDTSSVFESSNTNATATLVKDMESANTLNKMKSLMSGNI